MCWYNLEISKCLFVNGMLMWYVIVLFGQVIVLQSRDRDFVNAGGSIIFVDAIGAVLLYS